MKHQVLAFGLLSASTLGAIVVATSAQAAPTLNISSLQCDSTGGTPVGGTFTCFGIVSGGSGGNKYTWDTAENVSISKQLDNSTRSIIDGLCKLGKPSLRLTFKDRSGVTATRTTSFKCAGIAL